MATEQDYPDAHCPNGSAIGAAIQTEANKELPKISKSNLTCPVKHGCCWFSAGLEDLFRSMIANWFAQNARERTAKEGNEKQFNEVIFHPATRAEGTHPDYPSKGGFDLSVGVFPRSERARIALKHVSGEWVDKPWNYTPTGEELDRLQGHIRAMLTAYHEPTRLEEAHPYLGIVACHCLHEYRRMGRKVGEVYIPGLTDNPRLTLVDLLPIAPTPQALAAINWSTFSLSVTCDGNGTVTPAWWVKPDEKKGLSKVTLEAIANSVFPVAQVAKGEQ